MTFNLKTQKNNLDPGYKILIFTSDSFLMHKPIKVIWG